jgi:hypothetical protein
MSNGVTNDGSGVVIVSESETERSSANLDAQAAEAEALLAEEQAAEQAREAAQAQYGFGLASGRPLQGSLSNEELMAWVAQHNDKLNGSLRDLMATADDRIQLAEDFTKVKGLVGAKLDQGTAKAAAQAMIAEYEGTPYEHEVKDVLEPLVADLEHRMKDWPGQDLPDDILDKNTGAIQQQIDSIQKQDQLDMIAIQDLTSRIRENTQLVSNMISSINQTTMSIVGNVGRA